MRKSLLLFKTCILLIIAGPVLSQNDEKSTLIGNPNHDERTMNVVADNSGNVYVGGKIDHKGLLVKQNSLQVVQWSKTLIYTSNPADEVSIAFLDVIGDTLFGCGKIHQGNSGIGCFYFKMNAQTGGMYWSKYETSGQNYFSVMRYANGKYFLVGGEYGVGGNYRGRIACVSSQSGNLVWQTPGINYIHQSTAINFHLNFLGSTEMINGKMYVLGNSEGINPQGNLASTAQVLLGITEAGVIFFNRYFLITNTSLIDCTGGRIEYDSDLNLVMGIFSKIGTIGQTNCVFLKCDTTLNTFYAKFYSIAPSLVQYITSINETATGYVLYGYYNSTIDGMYAMKVSKSGVLQKCVSITKPNVSYQPLWNTGYLIGNSTYANGKHYFPATENSLSANDTDINQIILDENLNYAEDCSEITELFPLTINAGVAISGNGLAVGTIPGSLAFSNGGTLEDLPLDVPCANVSLDLQQAPNCAQVDIIANTTGFIDPIFYWSNGTSSTSNTITVSTTDTVFVRVLDTKCCELLDTIVPTLVPSSFTMSLPGDTVICLQSGNGYSIVPTFSGASGMVQYLWSNNSTGNSLNVTQSGTYWVDVSDNCETLRDSIVVTVHSLPVISQVNDTVVCEGSFPITLNPMVSAGATVLWEDGTTSVSRIVNSAGAYTISATNDCGTVNATIAVSQIDLPTVQLIGLIDTCVQTGGMIPLVPVFTNTNTVLWSDGSSGNQLLVSNSGNYTVYASNSCGIDSASCLVTINHFPELDLPAVLDTCFEIGVGFSYTAFGSSGSYQWSSGSQTATEWISQEGMYTCTLTNGCGSVTDTMLVHRMPEPDLYFPEDSISYCQRNLSVSLLHIETNYNLEILAPYHGTITTNLTESGWYKVHVFNGCWHKWDSIYVDLQDDFFYLPNSFTPNGDSHNDRFEFKGENIVIREVRIFNRWGEEVFTGNGAFEGWDGMYRGEICPDGIYSVHLIYEDCFGMPTEFAGHVNLVK